MFADGEPLLERGRGGDTDKKTTRRSQQPRSPWPEGANSPSVRQLMNKSVQRTALQP